MVSVDGSRSPSGSVRLARTSLTAISPSVTFMLSFLGSGGALPVVEVGVVDIGGAVVDAALEDPVVEGAAFEVAVDDGAALVGAALVGLRPRGVVVVGLALEARPLF